ncbi:hypothetical protein MXL46_12780 [Heyndrickxia sporothermodurans]|uniref:Uncharacterized protein n=1 Tax=Heyndrickxia sporothermodurans TaxID=46224 RepID=A0A150L6E8_9BACI|nr:hypothetical protein [Heyndrickxia sporothermodurans]KYD07893.1 hypothetical protein B4102_0527 [Heyndrickxia sporothermodurans]MBL5766918.1 hypothetical protein [Heyndrickxia sporothermodurans]MBL5770167.1 hypothetical protein [Heyndrickxia sporothermodurans]MBL5773803.1 hypothetical protein [Heyndrickxia sporothermodurans]MBL5777161.1 hypothetical protein [Heyndrickxia sporothermodurans]
MKDIEMKRGQPITFRLPSDTPDHILRHLEQMKETERRNFSSKIAELVLAGVGQSLSKHRETLTIPLPKGLNKAQRSWLKHEQSQALLGSIVYQLLTDPVRTASLIASVNQDSVEEITSPFYIEETPFPDDVEINVDEIKNDNQPSETISPNQGDDLENFDWQKASQESAYTKETEEPKESEDIQDLLGDFLAQMNK